MLPFFSLSCFIYYLKETKQTMNIKVPKGPHSSLTLGSYTHTIILPTVFQSDPDTHIRLEVLCCGAGLLLLSLGTGSHMASSLVSASSLPPLVSTRPSYNVTHGCSITTTYNVEFMLQPKASPNLLY